MLKWRVASPRWAQLRIRLEFALKSTRIRSVCGALSRWRSAKEHQAHAVLIMQHAVLRLQNRVSGRAWRRWRASWKAMRFETKALMARAVARLTAWANLSRRRRLAASGALSQWHKWRGTSMWLLWRQYTRLKGLGVRAAWRLTNRSTAAGWLQWRFVAGSHKHQRGIMRTAIQQMRHMRSYHAVWGWREAAHANGRANYLVHSALVRIANNNQNRVWMTWRCIAALRRQAQKLATRCLQARVGTVVMQWSRHASEWKHSQVQVSVCVVFRSRSVPVVGVCV